MVRGSARFHCDRMKIFSGFARSIFSRKILWERPSCRLVVPGIVSFSQIPVRNALLDSSLLLFLIRANEAGKALSRVRPRLKTQCSSGYNFGFMILRLHCEARSV